MLNDSRGLIQCRVDQFKKKTYWKWESNFDIRLAVWKKLWLCTLDWRTGSKNCSRRKWNITHWESFQHALTAPFWAEKVHFMEEMGNQWNAWTTDSGISASAKQRLFLSYVSVDMDSNLNHNFKVMDGNLNHIFKVMNDNLNHTFKVIYDNLNHTFNVIWWQSES